MKKAICKWNVFRNCHFKKIEIKAGDILKIDKRGYISKYGFDTSNIEMKNPFYTWGYSCDYESEYMRLLMQFGKSNGISEWEFYFLMENGYSIDEIELLLSNITEWKDTIAELADNCINEV